MLSTIFFLFATSIIMVVQSQTWTGTFTADSKCNTAACCCLNGQIVITNYTTNTTTNLAFTSGVKGACADLTIDAATYTGTIPYPNNYTGYLANGAQYVTLTLSPDSNTISTVDSRNSACNGNAKRNSAIKQFGNTMAIAALVFIGLTQVA
jgi:hypothetical protein